MQPEFRLNEVRTFVEAGLQDLSISRTSFQWGIPVPDDPKHVMYVWFDALTNYLTALGFGSAIRRAQARVERFWPAVDSSDRQGDRAAARPLLAGVPDVSRAHAAAPHHRARLVADGRRQDVEVDRQRRALSGLRRDVFGVDALRYFVMREMPLGQDANFSDEGMLTRFNADLANDLGNVVSRATTMVQRYSGGTVPVSPGRAGTIWTRRSKTQVDETIARVKQDFEAFQITLALQRHLGAHSIASTSTSSSASRGRWRRIRNSATTLDATSVSLGRRASRDRGA